LRGSIGARADPTLGGGTGVAGRDICGTDLHIVRGEYPVEPGRIYSGKLELPYDAFAAGLGDHRVVTTLCPGGKERMRRLMELVRARRIDLTPLLTHTYSLADIGEAYALFGERRDGVIKVAIRP
jgi:threonine dehydrogenase-like Zn-dependent dehydrogenase